MTVLDRLTTLDALWTAWSEYGRTMTDEQWGRATRLGDWDVRSLYAHAAMWPAGFATLIGRAGDLEPSHPSAAALLRDFNSPEGIARRGRAEVATGARRLAADHSTAELIEQFAGTGPQAVAAARDLGPVVVDYFGLAVLRLDEAVSVGIVEATVHLLDLQHALGLPSDVPSAGLTHTAAVLTEMAPPVELIEVATGRSTTGPFPVMT
jgi:uncharacterized protein (TIGR03083 family)